MSRRVLLAFATLATLAMPTLFRSGVANVQQHERLRVRNTFKSPEEVVSYYCARDASGFIWSGLLESERRAFTTWREAPQHELFYIARKYELVSAPNAHANADSATVEVRYELTAMGDAHGTRSPAPRPYSVTFSLKRVGGAWKIAKPDSAELPPVVLESKFF